MATESPVAARVRGFLRGARRFIWRAAGVGRARREPRRVLLVVGNEMAAGYVGAVKQLLDDDSRIAFATTGPPGPAGREARIRRLAGELGAPFVGRVAATLRSWDLILFPNHYAPHHFAKDIPKLFIHHSHDSGKKLKGQDHRYGRRFVLDESGQPLYTRFLEMSDATERRVVGELPALAGRIAVVGDLMVDRMLALSSRRDEVRSELGFAASDRVALLMSTFGPDSMMETLGEELLQAAEALLPSYRVVLSTHPNHWSGPHAQEHPWGARLVAARERGFNVIEPGDDWVHFAVASDFCLSDHTSLAVTYALLGKPLAFVPVNPAALVPDTFGAALYEASPRLEHSAQLAELAAGLAAGGSSESMQAQARIAREIDSHPGEAAARIRAEVYALLELPTPQEPDGRRPSRGEAQASDMLKRSRRTPGGGTRGE